MRVAVGIVLMPSLRGPTSNLPCRPLGALKSRKMSAALIGLIGVIAGAAATTGTELLVNSRKQRNDSLAAARLVWGALEQATNVVSHVLESDNWGVGPRGMERAINVWDENREILARSVDNFGYRVLEYASVVLRETVEQAGDYDQAGFDRVKADERLPEDFEWLEKATIVARKAGITGWERVTKSRRTRQWESALATASSARADA
jgi:hypothetical protein